MASVPTSVLYRIGDLELDIAKGSLRRGSQEIHLKPKAFQILVYLVAQRDRLVSKDELLDQFWKHTVIGEDVLAHSIAEVRRALGDSSRAPAYLKTVPKRGYLFVADVQEISCEPLTATEEITTIEVREEYSDSPAPGKLSRTVFAIAVATTAMALALTVAVFRYWPAHTPNRPDSWVRTVIVPFENRSARSDMDWLRAGLADMLATSLSASPRISLITPRQLEGALRSSSGVSPSYEEALRGARQSGAGAMIMGAYASIGDAVRVDTQIYDVHSGLLVGGESLTVQKSEFLLSQLDTLSSKLAARLGAPLLNQARLAEVMTNNLEAYRLYSLGLARTRDFRLPEAIALFQKAVELDPGFAMAYARIGFAYSSTWGRQSEGKPYLEKAYRLSDRLTQRDRLFIRAWYLFACRDYTAAEHAYRQIVSAFPLEVEAYHALGTLLGGDGRYAEAREILQRGITIEPDMPQLHNMLSTAYLELGETQKALESAQRYVSLSGEPNAFDTLACAYQRLGHYSEAEDSFLKAIHSKPDFEIAIIHLGNLYFQLGRYREALEQYREYTRLAPSTYERIRGHSSAAWVYWRKSDFKNAEAEAGEATRLNHSDTRESTLLKADRGYLVLNDDLRRRILGASSLSGRGARENRRIPLFIAGHVALRDHKADEALQYFRAAAAEPPIYWSIDPLETCLADGLLELGRLDEAVAEYQRVLRLNENYPMARYRLGLALERKGLPREARAEFERFLTIWKNADADIPELIDARRRYTSLPSLRIISPVPAK